MNIFFFFSKERLKKKLEDIETETTNSEENLHLSEILNTNSTQFNEEAAVKLETLQNILNELEVHNNEFKSVVDNNDSELDEISKSKPDVAFHAENLTQRAMQLDNILSESRDLSSDAIQAVDAYRNITKAVENANLTAKSALDDIKNANDLLDGVESQTFNTAQDSAKALDKAFELYRSTNDDLDPQFDSAKTDYDPVQIMHKTNDEKLKNLVKILENLQNESLEKKFKLAADKADNAIRYLTNIEGIAKGTFDELKNESSNATLLPKIVDDMNRNLLQTSKQLNIVNEKLPTIVEIMDELPEQQDHLQRTVDNIENSLKKLSQQIVLARDLANQIKIGMKFYPNTTLELRNPSNMEELSTSERISGYFKTDKLDGLIWYLGNPVGTNLRRTKTVSFT